MLEETIHSYHQNGTMTRAACKHSERLLLQFPSSQTLPELLSETTSHATTHFCHKQKQHRNLTHTVNKLTIGTMQSQCYQTNYVHTNSMPENLAFTTKHNKCIKNKHLQQLYRIQINVCR